MENSKTRDFSRDYSRDNSRSLYKHWLMKICSFLLSTMADSFSYVWMACLSDSLVRDVIRRSKAKCAGCQSGMSSPILHKHETQNLLEKLNENFEEARIYNMGTISKLYERFQHLLPHSTDLTKDKEVYHESANYFLMTATAHSIFYGQYINGNTDNITRDAFKPVRRSKRPKKSLYDQLMEDLDISEISNVSENTVAEPEKSNVSENAATEPEKSSVSENATTET